MILKLHTCTCIDAHGSTATVFHIQHTCMHVHTTIIHVHGCIVQGKYNITSAHPMYPAVSHRPVGSEGETPDWQTLAFSEHVPAVLVTASLHTACRGKKEEMKKEEEEK